jgi:hypothetical protein
VVVESVAVLPEPQTGVAVAADTKKSPEEPSGTPMNDEDSVIVVEDSKPAAVPFGRAAYKKPDSPQVVAAVAVEAQPEAEKEKKPKPEPLGVQMSWTQFLKDGKSWSRASQKEKDKAILKWAEYAHWRAKVGPARLRKRKTKQSSSGLIGVNTKKTELKDIIVCSSSA